LHYYNPIGTIHYCPLSVFIIISSPSSPRHQVPSPSSPSRFSSRQNEWKHCKDKHPELVGESGVSLNQQHQVPPHIADQIDGENIPNYHEQADEEHPGFGFDDNNDDAAAGYNELPALDANY
jgi:hypothetical protein